jgi:drug/metabolite transporter (DMT)-like permease
MARRDVALIVVLSLIWGASFMFIKIADRSFDPSALVWLRLLLGCAVMVPAALAFAGPQAILAARPYWWRIALLGFANTAAPFLLISWAETRIDSGLAGILQAAAPIFSAAITTRFGNDRVTGSRLIGVLVGFAGVGLLVGSPGRGGVLAALAVVLAALGYATGASLGTHLTRNVQPIVVGTLSTVIAAVLVTPLGVTRLPSSVPGWKEDWSLVVLGVVGTGLAYILAYELLRSAGASRTILITYLIPGVALLYGVVLLGEPLRGIAVAGLVLILAGVALAGRHTHTADRARPGRDVSSQRRPASISRRATSSPAGRLRRRVRRCAR